MSRVEELRAGVDQLDREIQRLVGRRRELSAQIQSQRLRGGGARHDLAREDRVIAAYVLALGPEGADLAHALLRLCRGPAHRPDTASA
jgi:chorismate mutase